MGLKGREGVLTCVLPFTLFNPLGDEAVELGLIADDICNHRFQSSENLSRVPSLPRPAVRMEQCPTALTEVCTIGDFSACPIVKQGHPV